jgi:hypothetical protein
MRMLNQDLEKVVELNFAQLIKRPVTEHKMVADCEPEQQ